MANRKKSDSTILSLSDYSANRLHTPNYTDRSDNAASKVSSDTAFKKIPLADLIRKYRKEAGISQQDLGDILGVTRNTVVNWEGGKYRPDIDLLLPLCSIFGITLYELFGETDPYKEAQASSHEQVLLSQYRQISPVSQRIVDRMVHSILDEEILANDRILDENALMLDIIPTLAAAGDGYSFSDIPIDGFQFVFKNDRNLNANGIIKVKGHSMEPVYMEGDVVYVQYTNTAEIGEDVICSSCEGIHIKRLGRDGVYSVNEAFPFTLTHEDDHVEIIGRVLGIVSSSDYANEQETDSLMEIRHNEVMAFKKKHQIVYSE